MRFSIIWIKKTFNETCLKHFSALLFEYSLNKTLLKVIIIYYKCFTIPQKLNKSNVFYRNILFSNMRIDKNNQLTICNFDMVVDIDSKITIAIKKTNTFNYNKFFLDRSHSTTANLYIGFVL